MNTIDWEIQEYMSVYFEMMLDVASWQEDDTRFSAPWYKRWKATGDIDEEWLSHEQIKKLKNKQYQLKIGKLDQSFIIWRLMKQKQDALNTKHTKKVKKLEKKLNMKQRMVTGLLNKLNCQ